MSVFGFCVTRNNIGAGVIKSIVGRTNARNAGPGSIAVLQEENSANGEFARFRPKFRLDPPKTPYIVRMPISIELGEGINAEWLISEPESRTPRKSNAILDEVISRIAREVALYPQSVRARVNLATALLNAGRTDESLDQLSSALRLDPLNYAAQLTIARVFIVHGRLTEAEEIYHRMNDVSGSSQDPIPLMGLAYIAIQRKNFDRAVELLKRLTGFGSTSTMARYHLATILMDQDRYREAIANLREAIRNDVRTPALYEALGVAYASMANWQRSLRAFNTALTLGPGTAETIRALCLILFQQGQHEHAVPLLESLTSKYPGDFKAREMLAESFLRSRKYKAARGQLQLAIESMKRERSEKSFRGASITNNIGVCCAFLDDDSKAKEWYEYSIELGEDKLAAPYNNLARVCIREGLRVRALELAERCIELFPKDEDTCFVHASCLVENGRVEEAVEALQRAIDEGQPTSRFFSTLGVLWADQKRDTAKAKEILLKGHQLYPTDPAIGNNLAYVCLMREEVVEARRILESFQVESIEPVGRVAMIATWGLLKIWEGDLEKGRSEYRRAEEIANQSGNRALGKRAMQKMHLELARAYLRKKDLEHAMLETAGGLEIRERTTYREDLEELNELLNGVVVRLAAKKNAGEER
jgi:tetratricopeptide (TPR) repeat protein